jgi:uncharacterized protein with HEPN domain
MRPESVALLWDVRNAAARITGFIDGVDSATYAEDELRRSAVERQLEIIGEALKNLRNVDPETANLVPDLARIIGLRNVLAHGYTTVDDAVVWSAASSRVPDLRHMVERLLSDLT